MKLSKKLKYVLVSIFSLLIGTIISFCGVIYINLPESYQIPNKVVNQSSSLTGIDVNLVKTQQMSIHFLELGNVYTGDCTLIDIGDTEILIDAGSKSSSVNQIKQYIDQYVEDGIIEYVIVTHAHEDHIAGFSTSKNVDSLFDLYDVENIIEFAKTNKTPTASLYSNYLREKQELSQKMQAKGTNLNIFTALDCVNEVNSAKRVYNLTENIKLEILYQEFYEKKATTENNYSVCFQLVENEQNYYMFTGDLEKEGEISLVNENKVGGKNEGMLHEVQLYKAGHHGSKTSSSEEFLSVIKPHNVCVCCCAGSSEYTSKPENQFPTQEFVNRISAYTQNVFVTTLCLDYKQSSYTSFNGNICVYYSREENKIIILCSNNATKLKDTEWFATNRTMPSAWQ